MINSDSFFLKCHRQEEGDAKQTVSPTKINFVDRDESEDKVVTIPQTISDKRCRKGGTAARTACRGKDAATISD